MIKILVLEQTKSMRNNLVERLKFEGYEAYGYEEVEMFFDDKQSPSHFDFIICDTPAVLSLSELYGTPAVVIPHTDTIDDAQLSAQLGAIDMLSRPIDMNRLLSLIRSATTLPSTPENQPSSRQPIKRWRKCSISVEEMIGEGDNMRHLKQLIDKVAPSDARVMILGENGTGKEMVAKWIHSKSNRAAMPFVEINCAAIPAELIESELFGHEKGAFTSAIKQRRGKFEQANGGTLFMDEIGDMSLSAQAKVLRALQERKICRVGSDKDIDVDVRVVAATNKDIKSEIAHGTFREDLYHRIGVIEINVCPLRQRREDIPLLVDYFLKRICTEYNISPCKSISKEAISLLQNQNWSGNIRELRNIVERLVILSEEKIESPDIEVYCLSSHS